MQVADWGDARERKRERILAAELHDFDLMQFAEWADECQRRLAEFGEDAFQCAEERIAGVVERVAAEHAEGKFFDAVKLAPDGRLDREQQIAARQVDSFVWGARIGSLFAGEAPVAGVEVVQREFEHDEREQILVGGGLQKFLQAREFGRLPMESGFDVDGLDDFALLGQVGNEDGTIEAAAGEDADGGLGGHWVVGVLNREARAIRRGGVGSFESEIGLARGVGGRYYPGREFSRLRRSCAKIA